MTEQWRGHTVVEIVAAYGGPTQIVPDGQGGAIYIFADYGQIDLSLIRGRPSAPIDIGQTIMFFVNAGGQVYAVRVRG